jgi:hypothetical protein
VLQEWEGIVEGVTDTLFKARLRDKTAGDQRAYEEAELSLDDVSPDDRELLREGAVFYLTSGRRMLASGRHELTSRIVFRRLPQWTQSKIDSAKARARNISDYFKSLD